MASHEHAQQPKRVILHRGEIKRPEVAAHAFSPHFNYGLGFFETILYDNGRLMFFQEHLERMRRTCADFEIALDYSQITEPLILRFLNEASLKDHCCRVKILYAPLEDAARWDTVVTAAPYTRPGKDFTLSVHDEIYDSKLNLYKRLNYHYNLYWKDYYAKKDHSDEVLLRGRAGGILEGSYTNILYLKDATLHYVDKKNNYLHGIMQDRILQEAEKMKGIRLQSLEGGIDLDRLKEADEVMICNSLMMVQNVKRIICGEERYTWPSSPGAGYLAPVLRENILYNCG